MHCKIRPSITYICTRFLAITSSARSTTFYVNFLSKNTEKSRITIPNMQPSQEVPKISWWRAWSGMDPLLWWVSYQARSLYYMALQRSPFKLRELADKICSY